MSSSLYSYLKNHIAIVEVVSSYVRLKLAGSYYKGSCPFHKETDASFTVSPDKNIFYCFGCQESGDVIAFIAKVESATQFEAAQLLIDRYKITVPDEISKSFTHDKKNAQHKKSYFSLCQAVAAWTKQQLSFSEQAIAYIKKRNISAEMCRYFGIGYFPGGSAALNSLIAHCAQSSIMVKDLIEAGILFQGKTSVRSPFEHRIVFPIKDTLGRYCGFGGRIFMPNDSRAKYYNSKESSFFVKGQLLFGFDVAKSSMQERKNAFLVEGYTDCVAMAQYGYTNTVATLGTACTRDHLQLLSRFVTTVFVLYDGDNAGQKAIMRLTQLCWDSNIELKVIILDPSDDPASCLEREGERFSERVGRATDIFSFFIAQQSKAFHTQPLAEKLRAVDAVIDIIQKIDHLVKQEVLLQQAAQKFSLPLETLRSYLAQRTPHDRQKYLHKIRQKTDEQGEKKTENLLEDQITGIYLQDNQLQIPEVLYDTVSSRAQKILEMLKKGCSHGDKQCYNCLLDLAPESLRPYITAVSMKYQQDLDQSAFDRLIQQFLQRNWKTVVMRIRTALDNARQSGDREKVSMLLQSFTKLKNDMQEKGII